MKKKSFRSHRPELIGILAAFLVIKYVWTLMFFDVPLGYDAGIYRYLFSIHAGGWPPFMLADAPAWTQSHPLGLFFFSSILLRLGVPVDWLIGWIWNFFPVVLSVLIAWTWHKRDVRTHGFDAVVMLCALLSSVQFDGFTAMYWKAFVAFAWCVLSFRLIERTSAWWILPGMLTLATHLQVGLILGVSVMSVLVSHLLADRYKDARFLCWTGLVALVSGALWYVLTYPIAVAPLLEPVFQSLGKVLFGVFAFVALCSADAFFLFDKKYLRHSIGKLLPYAFIACIILVALVTAVTGSTASGVSGSFISLSDYLTGSFPLLVLGATGLLLSFRRERGSVWQWAVLWCAGFALTGFFFHLRFILPLDFFLLPFCALGVYELWRTRATGMRLLVVCLLVLQAALTAAHVTNARPELDSTLVHRIAIIGSAIPKRSVVLTLDNITAPWMLGFMPHARLVAPGIFESRTEDEWTRFLYGSREERLAFLRTFERPLFLYASPVFDAFYPPEVKALFDDRCLDSTPYAEVKYFACQWQDRDATP